MLWYHKIRVSSAVKVIPSLDVLQNTVSEGTE